jgi:hypothetical protein
MTDKLDHHKDEVTGGGEWGDTSLPSIDDARAYIASRMEELAIVVENASELPPDADIRPNGRFMDIDDVAEYLERGGLVIAGETDENGVEHWQPGGLVYIIAEEEPDGSIWYQVYIKRSSS